MGGRVRRVSARPCDVADRGAPAALRTSGAVERSDVKSENGTMTDGDTTATASEPFRACGACRERWATSAAFLEDARLSVVGLQVAEHMPEANLLVFEHACGSSVSVRASRLRFLLPDPAEGGDLPSLWGTEECQQLCRRLDEWKACDRPCVNARDRSLLQLVLRIKAGPAD